MSIYITVGVLKVEKDYGSKEFIEVWIQLVPPMIWHPSYYSEDIFADWLPPISEDCNPDTGKGTPRAVVFVDANDREKNGQRYLNPLFMMTGEEYNAATFQEVFNKITDAVAKKYETRNYRKIYLAKRVSKGRCDKMLVGEDYYSVRCPEPAVMIVDPEGPCKTRLCEMHYEKYRNLCKES